MVAVRSFLVLVVLSFAAHPRALAQEGEGIEVNPTSLPPERPPSLVPPLVVTAAGAGILIGAAAVRGMESACFSCIDLLGDGDEGDTRGPSRVPRVMAGVGGGLLMVGVGWLLARQHARMRWRSRPHEPAARVSLVIEPAYGRYGLGLYGAF